jgi:hypothetical protein
MSWGTRQLGPWTTRTETSQSVNEDESARMLRQLGPYEKTTRTINNKIPNYLCLGHVWKFTIEVSIANIPLLYRIRRPSGEVNTTSSGTCPLTTVIITSCKKRTCQELCEMFKSQRHTCINGYQTTRPVDNSDRDKSVCKRGWVCPYVVEIHRKITFYLLCLNCVQIKITHNNIVGK